MNANPKLARTLEILGFIAFLVGSLDPMEGSVLIAPGSVLIALAMWIGQAERPKKIYWLNVAVVIVIDVAWLLVISEKGGFGGRSGRSMWWGLTLLPYPLAWIAGLIGIFRELREYWNHRHHHPATT